MSALKMRRPAVPGGPCDDLANGRPHPITGPDAPSSDASERSTMAALKASAPAGFDGERAWDDRPKRQRADDGLGYVRRRLRELERIMDHRHGEGGIPPSGEQRYGYAIVAADTYARTHPDALEGAVAGWWRARLRGVPLHPATLEDVCRLARRRRGSWCMTAADAAAFTDFTLAERDAIGRIGTIAAIDATPRQLRAHAKARKRELDRERAAAKRRAAGVKPKGEREANAAEAARLGITVRALQYRRAKAREAEAGSISPPRRT